MKSFEELAEKWESRESAAKTGGYAHAAYALQDCARELREVLAKLSFRLELTDDGAVLHDVFNGVGIQTSSGLFGVAQRDGGIEVLHEGKSVWASGPVFVDAEGKTVQKSDDCAINHGSSRTCEKGTKCCINRHSPVTPDFVLARIECEHRKWSEKNFKQQEPLEQIAGMTEEYGEACEAMGDKTKFLDAVGDFSIFFFHYCRLKGWTLAELWAERLAHQTPGRPWPQLLGRLAHHELKMHQEIRGTPGFHAAAGRGYAAALLKHLEHVCSQMGVDYVTVVSHVWDEVKKRDWAQERESTKP